jgi:diaminohydroxyphosphoribosylaminopyrimidine deaminase/5-amino-6-(5-phosphoribosylamino)uracil reductase
MNHTHEKYMHRCIELASKAAGSVSPNPMVGSVIVHNGVIIGEGYHRKCGEAHAEVNAVNSVKDKSMLKESTIYVSLEPCAHVGRTPACADMIIHEGIPEIVIGSTDPYFMVDGKGIQKLESAGRTVITGILEKECIELNKRFYTYHTQKRPYIILKWAQTKDGYVDFVREPNCGAKAFWITNEFCKTLVHKWRTEEDAFLVGFNTVLLDDPQLTARNWSGRNPLRIAIDEHCQFDKTYQIFDNQADTIILNSLKDSVDKNVRYIKIDFTQNIISQILNVLYDNQIQSLVVEGGSQTLESFISEGMWDEARVFTGNHIFGKGVPAPVFNHTPKKRETFGNSELRWYFRKI